MTTQSETNIEKQLKGLDISPQKYLSEISRKAKLYGISAPRFSLDKTHKLEVIDPSGKIVRFGRVGYGDFLIYSYLEKAGHIQSGYSQMKRQGFHKSHSAIGGKWKSNKYSPNNLALHILW
jgi:hypothetical protein